MVMILTLDPSTALYERNKAALEFASIASQAQLQRATDDTKSPVRAATAPTACPYNLWKRKVVDGLSVF